MKSIVIQGQKLAYRDEATDPALVMLSANPGESRDFDAITSSLARGKSS